MFDAPDTPPTVGGSSATSSPASLRGRLGGRGVFAGVVVAVVVVALVAVLLLSHGGNSGNGGATIPGDWQVFHDPAGYFTIGLPPGWTANGGVDGSETNGGRAGSYTSTSYDWVMRDPATGSDGPGVFIDYHPLPNTTARQLECQFFTFNTTFDGVPASLIGGNPGWIIATESAHYQLNYGFPSGDNLVTVPPTPIPAATATAGMDLSAQVAATFAPTPAMPLSC